MKDTEKIARLSGLLQDALAALQTIERATVDEYGRCRVELACSECPLRADTPSQQCEWIRAREARELLEEVEHG